MKTKLIIIFLAAFIFTGCVTQKKCSLKFPTQNTRDSIYIETQVKVPVLIPGDSVYIDVPVDCPDQNVAIVENGKLKQTISILKGRLYSATLIKPDTFYVYTTKTKTVVKEVKVPQPVKFIPKFWKIAGGLGIAFVLLVIVSIVLKIKKIL